MLISHFPFLDKDKRKWQSVYHHLGQHLYRDGKVSLFPLQFLQISVNNEAYWISSDLCGVCLLWWESPFSLSFQYGSVGIKVWKVRFQGKMLGHGCIVLSVSSSPTVLKHLSLGIRALCTWFYLKHLCKGFKDSNILHENQLLRRSPGQEPLSTS